MSGIFSDIVARQVGEMLPDEPVKHSEDQLGLAFQFSGDNWRRSRDPTDQAIANLPSLFENEVFRRCARHERALALIGLEIGEADFGGEFLLAEVGDAEAPRIGGVGVDFAVRSDRHPLIDQLVDPLLRQFCVFSVSDASEQHGSELSPMITDI